MCTHIFYLTMKKLLLLAATLLALTGCGDKSNKPSILRDATLNIHVKSSLRGEGKNQKLLTPREIVINTAGIEFFSHIYGTYATRGFADAQRDVENAILKMWADDVVHEDYNGNITLIEEFLKAEDVIFLQGINEQRSDTIAYIPNAILRKAYEDIKIAFDKKDYDEVYRLFQTAYTAIPTTGEEYKRLKEQGLN